ncbi:TadE/TadG family type IV pilus assembly protein [Sphingomonas sp. R86521]|uniref:TadE/TadG family type IV pilus assembly protein n=1 Tax=Sphingomonas sp. R86521 TaxID=3093860 RepID=UPI0036D42CEE
MLANFARSFKRLLADRGGNTLVIMGFSLIPIAGMLGSAVDVSRAYLAKNRMQQACDAGTLAGRRVLVGNVFNQAVRDEAIRFFNFNYRQGEFDVATFTPTVTMPANGVIKIVAQTTIPTTLMRIFGFETLPVAVTCQASQNFVNTDVVLVLDTTGSMGDKATSTDTKNKLDSLKDAVLAFYDALAPVQAELAANGLRLRYSVVPYSSNVNVGREIMAANPNYMVSGNYTYNSRQANYTSTQSTAFNQFGSPVVTNEAIRVTGVAQFLCNITTARASGYNDSHSEQVNGDTKTVVDVVYTVGSGAWTSANGGTCTGNKKTTTTTYNRAPPTQTFQSWTYKPMTYNVSAFLRGAVTTPSEIDGSTSSWNGCIEERQTTSTITGSYTGGIPDAAMDMNINLIPTTNDQTKWAPYWPDVYWENYSSYPYQYQYQPSDACPSPVKRLQSWTRGDLNTYLNTLVAAGSTYHDNGMRWGARMISPLGIFGADTPSTYNNMPVNRFVIFMTDGKMEPNYDTYSMYGVERMDKRITGSSSANITDLTARHDRRFRMMCSAAKTMRDENGNSARVDIWVVAFASTLTSTLTECASNPGQAKTVADRASLIQQFVDIGNTIGSLRLTR